MHRDAMHALRSSKSEAGQPATMRKPLEPITWADVIFVMEREHKQWIASQLKNLKLPRIEILDIPDDYQYMDSELQRELHSLIDSEIDAILATKK